MPLLILKQNYFANIVAPFFDNFFGQNLEIYNAQAYSLRSTMGWLSDPSNFLLYLKPFLSFNLNDLTSSLGLVFFVMLVNFKLQKQTKYMPLILIILVLATGQILPRYYFEAFLLLSYFYKPEKLIVKLIIYSQVSVIFLISLIYIYFAYLKYDVVYNKKKYMNQFSYSFYNHNQHKKDKLDGNVLDFSLDRHSVFFDKNIYSTRYLDILDNFQKNHNKQLNFNNYILDNSIKYLIIHPNYQLPNCLKTEKINETYRKTALRNFLIKAKKEKLTILKITNNDCNDKNK